MDRIKVTIAQLIPKLGDKQHNLELISESMEKAEKERSHLVVFPELFLTGYSIGENLHEMAESEDGPSLDEIKTLCRKHGIYTVMSFPEKDEEDNYYISSALIDHNGKVLGIYRKTHLFDEEKKYFTPGSDLKVIDSPLGKVGMMICFDVEFPEIARALKLKGADFIVIVNANMHPYQEHHHLYVRSRSMENEIPVIICNRLGVEGNLHFCGDSMVMDATGKVLAAMNEDEGVKTVELPIKQTLDPKMSYTQNRRKELYNILTQ